MSAPDSNIPDNSTAHAVECDACSAMPDPWEDGKNSVEHLTDCEVDFCERCEHLIDGFYMSCDHCGHWGYQDSDGWTLCHGMPFCNEQCRDAYFGCDASDFSETEPLHLSQNDERMHHYQRRRASLTGLMVKLREVIETGRLVVVVMTRLVLLLVC
jgi:hypothetical protein